MATLDTSLYNQKGSTYFYSFATFPSVKIYKKSTGSSWNQHLLFGDFIRILDPEIVHNRVKARSRNKTGWIPVEGIQKNRILEVNFIDIGQGDGCHIVTPDDQHILVDAGEYDNMNRYLYWRFNLYRKYKPLPFPFHVVISHSDKDHYKGFEYIFKNDKIKIDKIFHNGIVERPGEPSAFGSIKDGYITTLVQDTADMLKLLENPNKRKGKNSMYLKTLHHVLKNNPEVAFKNLSIEDEHLMAYNEGNLIEGKKFEVDVLGPILEEKNHKKVLKSINNAGKDKNGHSVLLKLIYDKVRILLGGDINTEFGEMIQDYYKSKDQSDRLVMDVAKACHHGSNHFHYGFLETLNPIATVISSGDNESYAHPRPDAIGAFGKTGYSKTPLIFSTELARSNKEITKLTITKIADKLEKIKQNENTIKDLAESVNVFTEEIKKLKAKNKQLNKEVNSYITKFGMINLRTDGQNMIIAQKLEKEAAYGKWDIHPLTYQEDTGRFEHDDTH